MPRDRSTMWALARFCAALVVAVGCASRPTLIGPRPPSPVQIVDERRGGACGFLLFGAIPIGVNSRTERAYANALEQGDRGLVDTELKYSWWLVPGGVILCSVVRGIAYR